VVARFTDSGISGAKGRNQRPGLNSLMEGVTHFDKVMAVGRSPWPIASRLAGSHGRTQSEGLDLYLHQQSIDTSTLAGKAMFQMVGVFSEFERER
jgi:DNA invertase Pin-like site-specific DNA recombinase